MNRFELKGLLIGIGICLFQILYAQSFSQRYYHGYKALSPMGAQIHNGSFYTIGYAEDTTCNSLYAPIMTKFGFDGSVEGVLNYCISDTGQQTFQGTNTLVFLSNGNIVFHVLFGGGGRSLLYINDSLGQTLNKLVVDLGDTNSIGYSQDTSVMGWGIFDAIEHQSALYILTVEQYTNYDVGICVIKCDLVGNFVWRKRFSQSGITLLPSIIRSLPDGNVLIGGSKSNMYQRNAAANENEWSRTHIFTIDTAGNITDTWTDSNNKTYPPTEIIYTPDNFMTYSASYKKGQWLWDIYKTGYVCRLNWTNKIKSWQIFRGDSSIVTNYSDIDLVNNHFIATGSFASMDSITTFGGLTKIDLFGNVIWHRLYRGIYMAIGNDNYFHESAILGDGSIISSGQSNDIGGFYGDPVRYQGWITRVDSNGLGITNWSASIPIDESFVNNDLVIYPNPADKVINIASKLINNIPYYLTISDMLGREIFHQKVSNINISIPVDEIQNGTYFLSLSNGKSCIIRKVIIQH